MSLREFRVGDRIASDFNGAWDSMYFGIVLPSAPSKTTLGEVYADDLVRGYIVVHFDLDTKGYNRSLNPKHAHLIEPVETYQLDWEGYRDLG